MISLILFLVILGLCLYLVKKYIPMDPTISTIITVVVVLCIVWWLLNIFGIQDIPLPPHRIR